MNSRHKFDAWPQMRTWQAYAIWQFFFAAIVAIFYTLPLSAPVTAAIKARLSGYMSSWAAASLLGLLVFLFLLSTFCGTGAVMSASTTKKARKVLRGEVARHSAVVVFGAVVAAMTGSVAAGIVVAAYAGLYAGLMGGLLCALRRHERQIREVDTAGDDEGGPKRAAVPTYVGLTWYKKER